LFVPPLRLGGWVGITMELDLRQPGEVRSGTTIQVSDATFGREFNEAVVHQVVTGCLASARRGTRAQKTRSEVRGGGVKPWRQKGTGRARVGTIRSPLWRGGGVTFAARPGNYKQKINRKMYRAAMQCILSELARQERLIVVETLDVDTPKTRRLVEKLHQFDLINGLLVHDSPSDSLQLAARNLPTVSVTKATSLDPVSLVRSEKVLITVPAIRQIEEWLG
jgi:50S ribosomal protein L4, bacterial/organelle